MTQLEMFAQSYPNAESRRDTGIRESVEHADRKVFGWSDMALSLVWEFVAVAPADFLAEDVRDFARTRGLPEPPDGRAWGAVMRRASSAGYIKNVGYRAARSSNLSPKVLWSAS